MRNFSFLFLVSTASAFSPIVSNSQTSTRSARPRSSLSKLYATQTLADGLSKSVLRQGDASQPLKFGDVATVTYNVYTPSTKTTIAKSKSQKVVVGESVMIQGWEIGLSTMNVGEKAIIHITDAELYGYGKEGIPPVLGSMEHLDIELEVLGSEEQSRFGTGPGTAGGDVSAISGMTGSGDLGALDPMKPVSLAFFISLFVCLFVLPDDKLCTDLSLYKTLFFCKQRTPETIAAAYAARQEQMIIEKKEEKEGLEGWIEKAKEFYFFGFFEGETGEDAPWILRPSITFPIAFAVVGLGFYITYAVGGISERGAQITDELDDIVLSWNIVKDTIVTVALALNQN